MRRNQAIGSFDGILQLRVDPSTFILFPICPQNPPQNLPRMVLWKSIDEDNTASKLLVMRDLATDKLYNFLSHFPEICLRFNVGLFQHDVTSNELRWFVIALDSADRYFFDERMPD